MAGTLSKWENEEMRLQGGQGKDHMEVLGQGKEFGLYYKCVERNQKNLGFFICTSLTVPRLWDTMACIKIPTFHIKSEH